PGQRPPARRGVGAAPTRRPIPAAEQIRSPPPSARRKPETPSELQDWLSFGRTGAIAMAGPKKRPQPQPSRPPTGRSNRTAATTIARRDCWALARGAGGPRLPARAALL